MTDTSAPATGAPWRVLATVGCGSAIVEAALTVAGIDYRREELDYSTADGRAQLIPFNPLGQVPTVVLPDGAIMTESAALVLYVDGLRPEAGLIPPVGDPLRPVALRWLVFLVAAVYPTFTYGDEPAKWAGESGAPELRRTTEERRKSLWRQLEDEAGAPWFLGPRASAIDLYLAVMTRWRPGPDWFAGACPRIHAIAAALDRDPRLAQVWRQNQFEPR
jgi:GST-like protein